MTTETETYPDKQAYDDAAKRGSSRHIDGWRSVTNNKSTLTRTWNNDPPPPPTAEEIKIKDLKVKLKEDTMTFKELLELLRLTGTI